MRPGPFHARSVVGGTKSQLSNECVVVQQRNGKKRKTPNKKKQQKKQALKGSSSKLNFTYNKTQSDNFFNLSE